MVERKDNKRIGESPGRKRYLFAVLYAVSVWRQEEISFLETMFPYPIQTIT